MWTRSGAAAGDLKGGAGLLQPSTPLVEADFLCWHQRGPGSSFARVMTHDPHAHGAPSWWVVHVWQAWMAWWLTGKATAAECLDVQGCEPDPEGSDFPFPRSGSPGGQFCSVLGLLGAPAWVPAHPAPSAVEPAPVPFCLYRACFPFPAMGAAEMRGCQPGRGL